MKALLRAALVAAAVFLAGCEPDDFTAWATVVGVEEIDAGESAEAPASSYEDLRAPEPGWRIELRLDDGAMASVTHSHGRRYEPGERVRVLKARDGGLLL